MNGTKKLGLALLMALGLPACMGGSPHNANPNNPTPTAGQLQGTNACNNAGQEGRVKWQWDGDGKNALISADPECQPLGFCATDIACAYPFGNGYAAIQTRAMATACVGRTLLTGPREGYSDQNFPLCFLSTGKLYSPGMSGSPDMAMTPPPDPTPGTACPTLGAETASGFRCLIADNTKIVLDKSGQDHQDTTIPGIWYAPTSNGARFNYRLNTAGPDAWPMWRDIPTVQMALNAAISGSDRAVNADSWYVASGDAVRTSDPNFTNNGFRILQSGQMDVVCIGTGGVCNRNPLSQNATVTTPAYIMRIVADVPAAE